MKVVVVYALFYACLFGWSYPAFGQSQKPKAGSQSTNYCSDVRVDFHDNPNMTREERLEAMDNALLKSLGLYDECQQMILSGGGGDSASGTGSGGMGGAESGIGSEQGGDAGASDAQVQAGEDGSAGEAEMGAPVSSVATSDIKGTQDSRGNSESISESKSGREAEVRGSEQGDRSTAQNAEVGAQAEGGHELSEGGSSGNTGAIPEDVQKADNDSVLEAQIREAAMREKDPEIRARLWNEYRRYKGLPQK